MERTFGARQPVIKVHSIVPISAPGLAQQRAEVSPKPQQWIIFDLYIKHDKGDIFSVAGSPNSGSQPPSRTSAFLFAFLLNSALAQKLSPSCPTPVLALSLYLECPFSSCLTTTLFIFLSLERSQPCPSF